MKRIILSTLTILLFISCNKEPKIEYKYSHNNNLFECSSIDMELIKEAVYAFEDYIFKNYSFSNTKNLTNSYTNFLNHIAADFIPMAEKIDNHTKNVFNELKRQKKLWNESNNRVQLNYSSNLVDCIVNSIEDENIKTIFKMLTTSNTMKTYIIAPLLIENVKKLDIEKALTTYIALDMFYTKLFGLDLSLSPEELSKQIMILNKEKAIHIH